MAVGAAFCGAVGLHEEPSYETLEDLCIDKINRTRLSDQDVRMGKIGGLTLADEYGIYEVVDNAVVPTDAKYVDTRWQITQGKAGVKCRIAGREFTRIDTVEDAFAPTSTSTTSRCVDFYALKCDTDEDDPMVSFEADCASTFYQTPDDEDFYCKPPVEWLLDRESRGLSSAVVWKLKKQPHRQAARSSTLDGPRCGAVWAGWYPGRSLRAT